MLKIGTHNSGTGETSRKWYHTFLLPFARTQSKTITEQFEAGCRYFDFRVRKINGDYVICHGIWESKKTLNEALIEISNLTLNSDVYAILTYEGQCPDNNVFLEDMKKVMDYYKIIHFCNINVKKPTWTCIWNADTQPVNTQWYLNLDGSTWHTYLPIPWLWDRLYFRPHKFIENDFRSVDFL